MHEISIIESIVEIITAEMPKHNIAREEQILNIGKTQKAALYASCVAILGAGSWSAISLTRGSESLVNTQYIENRCRKSANGCLHNGILHSQMNPMVDDCCGTLRAGSRNRQSSSRLRV